MKKTKAKLLKKIHGGQVCQIVSTTARLGLADLLAEKPLSAEQLAKRLKIELGVLSRLLSSLVALHLLEEREGRYHLSDEGHHLAKNDADSLHALAVYKGSPIVWNAHGKLYEGIKKSLSPFELAFDQDLFSHLGQHEEHCAIFQEAMASYERQSSTKILDLYDFNQLPTFLDVGGGLGNFALTIMDKYPQTQGAVFDLPSVIRIAKNDRLNFHAGDFFESVPEGFEAYLLRNILHDWSDLKCVKILKNIRKACREKAKLLIFETFYDRTHNSRLGKFSDLTMFTLTPGGKERTLEEITELLNESGFCLLNSYQTTSSKSLVEAIPLP